MASKTIETQKPSEIADADGMNFFLTGNPGAGKTQFIGSAADVFPNEVLILSIEGGMRTLADRTDIDVVVVKAWTKVTEVLDVLAAGNHPFKVVAIDLVSEAYKLLLEQVGKEGMQTNKGQPTLEGYGVANTRFIKTLRDYRSLSMTQGIHVIFTAHANETKDEDTGSVLVRPNLTPGTLNSVVGAVDVVGYLEFSRSKKRLLHLVGSNKIIAKARVPKSFGEVPETLEDPSFQSLYNILVGGGVKGK